MRRKQCIIIMIACSVVFTSILNGQTNQYWHGLQRELHYAPQGTDFVKVNGNRKFNRALYGSNTGFRVEAGDLPEFALYMPGMGGNLRLGLVLNGKSKWITEAGEIRSVYRPGSMIYEIKDELLGRGTVFITILALPDAEGMVLKLETRDVSEKPELLIAYGGATGKKFSRDGDIGADPESSFYLRPEYCKDNKYEVHENTFELHYGSGSGARQLSGIFPSGALLQVGDASQQQSPLVLSSSSKQPLLPLITGKLSIIKNDNFYFLIQKPSGSTVAYNDLKTVFGRAEEARKKLAERIVVQTPDPYINTVGGALAMAADGIWEDPSYMHGAVAWRMRLPAWRGAYVADPLGWHDRAKTHFSSYALSQLTSPSSGPVVFDTALHLARQLEKLGTSMFSEGYICRNPNGDFKPHHYDMNLVFVDQLLNHFNWTGDTAYVKKMWPLLQRHIDWEKRNFDGDGDGLYDAYACIWASDALQYSGGGVTHSSAYNYRANKTMAVLAKIIGEDGTVYEKEAAHIYGAVQKELWLKDKGWYAEYKDAAGAGQVHPAAGLWTIYHAIDAGLPDIFQAYQTLRYVDNDIPHIPVSAKGLNMQGLQVLSTTNWQPYTWSVNNVALAENLHTSLAYWQGSRPEKAYQLWKSSLVESMYLSASPGGFEQLSFYDAVRGELYRDFADPIGMAARTLVEGLFGILPDVLHDTLLIKPGYPKEWNYASLSLPDIKVNFKRTGLTDIYTVNPAFPEKLFLQLQVPALKDDIASVSVNGKPAGWSIMENTGTPLIKIDCGKAVTSEVKIVWRGITPDTLSYEQSQRAGDRLTINAGKASIIRYYDPQQVLTVTSLKPGSLQAGIRAQPGHHTFFVLLKQGKMNWWQAVDITVDDTANNPEHSALTDAELIKAEPVNVASFFNDKITNIFRNRYISPRPVFPTLQLPTQGIGNWCYPLVEPVIDDEGLRRMAGERNEFSLPDGLRFHTPSDTSLNNIVFTSLWDNYPDSVNIPLSGSASHAYFLMAGTTNHMQSQLMNGALTVTYTDGTSAVLELKNPETWWPVEQDYLDDGYAFQLKQSPPVRVHFKDGKIYQGFAPEKSYTSIKGFSNRAIAGGAGTVLDMELDGSKQLRSLTVKAVANEVIIGLMAITLLKSNLP